jgi:hypothetical protein
MYRSFLVRQQQPFYNDRLFHDEDFEKHMQLLEHWDFGFVHQVLSFWRTDNDSISFKAGLYHWRFCSVIRYGVVLRYAPIFLAPHEAAVLIRETRRMYYGVLASEAVRFRGRAFWEYHQEGLKSFGQNLNVPCLAWHICLELIRMVSNPGNTAVRAVRFLKRMITSKTATCA